MLKLKILALSALLTFSLGVAAQQRQIATEQIEDDAVTAAKIADGAGGIFGGNGSVNTNTIVDYGAGGFLTHRFTGAGANGTFHISHDNTDVYSDNLTTFIDAFGNRITIATDAIDLSFNGTGELKINGDEGTAGQVLISGGGAGNPSWANQTVNTDAESKCNALESLRGDGTCVVPSSGGSEGTTVSDTAEIDLTLSTLDITADINVGSVDVLKLDSGVQTSLGLADTASQGAHTVDTNTQLSDAQVATAATNEGFVTGAHTVDTSSATICTGSDFLLGDGTCEDSTGLSHGDGSNCTAGFYALGVDDLGNAQGCTQHTDTSAQNICSGLESLRGNGTCVVPSSGGSEGTTVSDTSEIDLTLSTLDITADIVASSIDETKLDASVNASLDLADSASQGSHTVDTVLDQTGVEALGFVTGAHTVDTNTQLSDAQVATAAINEGFVTGVHTVDTNTNATTICTGTDYLAGDGSCDTPITDTNTQLSDSEVATAATNEGFVVGPHTTDTSSATICTGTNYLAGDGSCDTPVVDTNTQLSDAQVATAATNEGFVTGAHTTNTDAESKCTALESLRGDGTCVVPSSGGSEGTTVSDTAEIDLTLSTLDITADIVAGSIDESKLDASVNASLDLADSSIQSVHGNGTNCGIGEYARGVDANGNAENCEVDNDTTAATACTSGFYLGGAADGCIAQVTDTNTNAATICTGTNYLAGDGTCDAPIVDTNTNADTICTGLESLRGDGTCVTPSSGGSESTTVSDTAEIDLTETGDDITADIVTGSIDESKLDASVNASLDLADSASQGAHTTDTSATTQCTGAEVLSGIGICSTHVQGHLDGTNCSAGSYPLGVDASGNAQGCTVAGGGSAPTLTKSITVLDPSADTLGMFYTPVAITITGGVAYKTGGTNYVWNIGHAATRNGTQLDVYTLDKTTTQVGGGTYNSGFNDATIPALSYVWLEIISVSGSVSQGHVTLTYTED